MYLTVHATAGLILAQQLPNPYLVFLASLAAHAVLDLVPHGDELPAHFMRPQVVRRLLGAALIDGVTLASFLLLYVTITPNLPTSHLLAGIAGSVLPDALEGVYLLTQMPRLAGFSRLHACIHNFTKLKLRWQTGLLLQCLTFTALWLVLIQLN